MSAGHVAAAVVVLLLAVAIAVGHWIREHR